MDSGPLIDVRVARWAAVTVARRPKSTVADAAALRASVAEDLPRIDAATRSWSGLGRPDGRLDVRVVGRMGWVAANLAGLPSLFEPLRERITRMPGAAQVLGAQFGALFGLLSSRVLGQYVLPLAEGSIGQLVVVGPNLVELREQHGEIADDMRRAVLLHEATHGLQFEHAPWLAPHLRMLIHRYLADVTFDRDVVVRLAASLPDTVRRVRASGSIEPVMDVVLTESQRDVLDTAQGLMSLLEGHGSAAMFDAGDVLVADANAVREAFSARRNDTSARILNAVAGLELKRQQYDRGEIFVRAVVEQHGMSTVNRAFDGAMNLPGRDELDDPDGWARRVLAA
ncbi:MAG: zinc-dependent metalloprotease [Nitriliruptoraceae bacterium]